MKFLVAICKTPDTTAKIAFTNNDTEFNKDGIQFIMNPYDEWYALVRALEIVEPSGGTVTVINVGDASNDIIIRKALAIGANDAVRVDTNPQNAMHTAKQIAAYAEGQNFDGIFFGKETIDYNGNEVPAMVAELLNLPFVSYATELEVADNIATVSRDIEGGSEVCKITGPFVLSAAKGLAEQRIPNMRGIMMAKRKPLSVIEAVASDAGVQVGSFTLPEGKAGVKMVDPENMDELVRLLREEAKVI